VADAFESFEEIASRMQAHGALAELASAQYLGGEIGGDDYPLARPHLAARMHESLPRQAIGRNGLGEKYLDPPAAAVFSAAVEARWKDPRIVQHQTVALPEIAREIAKPAILPDPFSAVEDEHSRSRPVRQRLLRDQLVRETVVEFLELHL
jgi:hypothetical protein